MRTLLPLFALLAGCLDNATVTIDGVAIEDPSCEVPNLGCTVIAERDADVILPARVKPVDVVDIYVHSAAGDLGDAAAWRVNGAPVEVTASTRDVDGSDVTLAVPSGLVAGDVAIEADGCNTPYAFEVLTRIAGPNTTVPSGCTCNSTFHKIYCPVYNQVYTYCSSCCGY